MGDKRPRDQKPKQGLKFTSLIEDSNGKMDMTDNAKVSDHPYAQVEYVLLPDSNPGTPVTKRGKIEPTLSELQDNIVRLLADKIKENTDSLASLIKINTDTIEALKESTNFLAKEVQDVKTDVSTLRQVSKDHGEKLSVMEDKLNEMERYHRRWNLRIYGIAEKEGEVVKDRIVSICQAILPDNNEDLRFQIDVAHRIGKKEANKTRPVITRFTLRSMRDLIWKHAKDAKYLKDNKLRFGEDLTTRDKEARNKLWPMVADARAQGKKAFFVGARAIIDGKEIRV